MIMDFINGEVFAVDKPYGWTSFDAVKRVRGAIQRRLGLKKFKVGHAGTLDPLATGVLIICTGRATKRIEELQQGRKEYEATLRFGATTPSYDLEKEIDREYPYEHITAQLIEEALDQFRGEIMQVPPMFSAVKIDGKRAYKFARKGAEVELKAKPIEITRLELLGFDGRDARLRIECSKGTYIRSLARDIGAALDSGAHLIALRRTRVGDFGENEMLPLDGAVEMINTCEIETESPAR